MYLPGGIRLTAIVQGASNVGFGYDSDGRRTSLTLPNGVSVRPPPLAIERIHPSNYTLSVGFLLC
jgi:YD repeat-containing protein